jgi:hypothetical protein
MEWRWITKIVSIVKHVKSPVKKRMVYYWVLTSIEYG